MRTTFLISPVAKQFGHVPPLSVLEHAKMKRSVRVHPSQLLIGICKTQQITRSKPIYFIEPKTWERIWHWGVFSDNKRTFWYITGKKLVRIWGIKSLQSISLVKEKLSIYNSIIVLVQFLVSCNLFSHTMPIIVIRYCEFTTLSPQEVLQDK